MVCFRTDLLKSGVVMGIIIGAFSIISIFSNSLSSLYVLSTLSFVAMFSFPIIMGIKRKKSLGQGIPFGFWRAYRYSYSMIFVAYFIATLMFLATIPIIGKNTMPEFVISLLMETGFHPTQDIIDTIGAIYYGYAWLPYAAIKLFVAPAILAIIPALFIRNKRRKY